MNKLLISIITLVLVPSFLIGCNNNQEPPEDKNVSINVTNGSGTGTYKVGDTATLTATIPEGKLFYNWTKDNNEVSKDNPYTFTVNENSGGTYVANFNDITFTVTVIDGSGSGTYPIGKSVTITADEKEGYTFSKWTSSDQEEITDNPYTFNVSRDVTYTANYVEIPKTLAKMVAISDAHVKDDDQTSQQHLENALQYTLDNDIDVLIINGDLVNNNQDKYYKAADDCFTRIYGKIATKNRPEILFNMGNHEFYHGDTSRHQSTIYDEEVGAFRTLANKWSSVAITDNIYSRHIKGVNYIMACPGPEATDGEEEGHPIYLAALGGYSDQDFIDLKTHLDNAALNGDPIVLCTHHPWGYTYGGPSYGMPSDSVVNKMHDLLKNYPQIINLTSHTHYSSLHERAFDQTNYSSLNIGMLYKGKYSSTFERDENGELITYLNVDNRDLINDPQSLEEWGKTNYGVGIDFNEDKMIAKRINYEKEEDYKHGTWNIPYGISKDNMHEKFYYESGERSGEDLIFPEGAKLTLNADVYASSTNIKLSFPDVSKPWAVEGYKIEIKGKDGTTLKTTWWQSMFWVGKDEEYTYTFNVDGVINDEEYTISVYPMDMFGHYCTPLVGTVEGGGHTDIDEAELAAGDLFYTSSDFSLSNENLSLDRKCLDTYNGQPGYSLKITANQNTSGWPNLKFKLNESLDLSNSGLSFYAKFEVGHKWLGLVLYDSDNNELTNQKDHDFSGGSFSQVVYSNNDLKEKLKESKSLSDVRYIKIVMNFENEKGQIQKVYLDQLTTVSGEYETYTESTTLSLPEAIENWHSSTKHLQFHTNTITKFTFTLVKDGGDRVTEKISITIGDNNPPSVTNVEEGGWTITKNGSDYLVDIQLCKMSVNSTFGSDTATKINFREDFPVNIANISIVDS